MRLASLNNKSCGWKTRDYTGMPGHLEFRSREPILPSGELRVSSNFGHRSLDLFSVNKSHLTTFGTQLSPSNSTHFTTFTLQLNSPYNFHLTTQLILQLPPYNSHLTTLTSQLIHLTTPTHRWRKFKISLLKCFLNLSIKTVISLLSLFQIFSSEQPTIL